MVQSGTRKISCSTELGWGVIAIKQQHNAQLVQNCTLPVFPRLLVKSFCSSKSSVKSDCAFHGGRVSKNRTKSKLSHLEQMNWSLSLQVEPRSIVILDGEKNQPISASQLSDGQCSTSWPLCLHSRHSRICSAMLSDLSVKLRCSLKKYLFYEVFSIGEAETA